MSIRSKAIVVLLLSAATASAQTIVVTDHQRSITLNPPKPGADNDLLKDPKRNRLAAQLIAQKQCLAYQMLPDDAVRCAAAVKAIFEIYYAEPTYAPSRSIVYGVIPLPFPRDFFSLLKDERVKDFLAAVPTWIDEQRRSGGEVDLWKKTLEFAHGQRDLALMWLGVLFGNNNTIIPDAEEIRVYVTPEHEEGHRLWKDALEYLAIWSIPDQGVGLYPFPFDHLSGLTSRLFNPKFYHFYSFAYLATRLRDRGFDNRTIAFATFMVSNLYEYTKQKGFSRPKWALSPEPSHIGSDTFDLNPKDYILEDLYLGYVGPLFALQEAPRAMGYDRFMIEFSRSPGSFMTDYYFERLNRP